MGAHVPIRTCVACRARAPRDDLVRIARGARRPVLDATGAGRGAYVHPVAACIAALTAAALARALRGDVSEHDVGRLGDDLRTRLGVA